MKESIVIIPVGGTSDRTAILFVSPNIGSLVCANDSHTYCDNCKGFGRVMGNRICGICQGTGTI